MRIVRSVLAEYPAGTEHRRIDMRKTIIFASLAALLGLATLAQASDRSRSDMRDDSQVTRTAADDSSADRRDHHARHERSGERHDEYREGRHQAHASHDEDEAAEHRDRR